MRVLRITGLPEGAIAAAAAFYAAPPLPWERGTSAAGGAAPAGTPDLESAHGELGSNSQHPSPKGKEGWVPSFEGEDVVIVFPPADHTHRAWRLAAVQSLARQCAPQRVNALATADEAAIAAALAYLAEADGLTGQYLPLDDGGAGSVIHPAA